MDGSQHRLCEPRPKNSPTCTRSRQGIADRNTVVLVTESVEPSGHTRCGHGAADSALVEAMDGFAETDSQAQMTGLRWLEGQKLEILEASHGGGTLSDVPRELDCFGGAAARVITLLVTTPIRPQADSRRSFTAPLVEGGQVNHVMGLMVCRKENDK